MAVPARHTSKQKKRSRVSPKGYYKGRQVVNNNDNSNN